MSAPTWIVALVAAHLALLRFVDHTASMPQLLVHILLSLFSSFAVYIVYTTYIYPYVFSPLRGLPTAPGGHNPFGHFVAKIDAPRNTSLEQWVENIPNDGLVRVRESFGGDAVIATSPAMLKTVLVEHSYDYTKARNIRNILRLVLGDGLIVVEGDAHKFQKQTLRSSFGLGPIKELYPLFWQMSIGLLDALGKSLETQKGQDPIEFCVFCERVTLDIIGVAALGEVFDSLNQPADTGLAGEYHELLTVDTSRSIWFMVSFFLPQWLINSIPFWQAPKTANRITTNMHKFALAMASKRRTDLRNDASNPAPEGPRSDILSTLVRTTTLQDSQLADQVLTFLAAGHETTSSTLAWTAFALAKDEKLQSRLRDEIRANLPSPASDQIPSAAVLEKLPLLNAICHEGLRLYPPVPFTARTAIRETRLGEVLLPPGAQVWLPIWALNRSTHFWGANAAEFDPERWITDGMFNNNGGAPSNYCQMTFLHGPRTCIGQGFTKAELRCLVAAMFGRYHVKLAEDESKYAPEGIVTVKPKNGGLLNIQAVDGF